jgi:hypothetical protein
MLDPDDAEAIAAEWAVRDLARLAGHVVDPSIVWGELFAQVVAVLAVRPDLWDRLDRLVCDLARRLSDELAASL